MQRWWEQYLSLVEFLPAMAIAEVERFFTLSREELTAVETRCGPLIRSGLGSTLYISPVGRPRRHACKPLENGQRA